MGNSVAIAMNGTFSLRLHQLRCAVEAVSIVVQLPPSLLEPLVPARLDALHFLLVSCLQAATVSTVALGNITTLKAGGKVETTGTYAYMSQDAVASVHVHVAYSLYMYFCVESDTHLGWS